MILIRMPALLFFMFIICFSSPALCNHLDLINPAMLPVEAVSVLNHMREIEPMTADYHQKWEYPQPKDGVVKTVTSLYEQLNAITEKNKENGEIHLLMGILGYYGHNLDMGDYSSKADTCFARSAEILTDDYRPLWFAGMHFTKSNRLIEGYRKFYEAGKRFSPESPWFWAEYAMSCYLCNMPKKALCAFDKADKLNGSKIKWCDELSQTIRSKIKAPDPGSNIAKEEFWRISKTGDQLTITCYPFGFKVNIPLEQSNRCFLTEYKDRTSLLHILGTPTKKGNMIYSPEILITSYLPKQDESLDSFKNKFLYKEAIWKPYDLSLKLCESSYIGDSATPSGKKTGSRTIMTFFKRQAPKFNGVVLEEPRNEFNEKPEGTKFYRMSDIYERFEGNIYYMILFEAPKPIFTIGFGEFKDILSGFVVE